MKLTQAIFICFILSTFTVSAQTKAFKWPKSYQAAVSLTYDDALFSQLDNAIPALNKYQLKGSFYLTLSSPSVKQRLEDWRLAAKQGHELGNHTIYHPCSKSSLGRDWVRSYHDMDTKTLEQIAQEVDVANTFLMAIDGKNTRTMTGPCFDYQVKNGNYIEYVRNQFVAVKGNNPSLAKKFDLLLVADNVSAEQMISFVKSAQQQGGIANILFHGVGGDHLSVTKNAHNELLSYLDKNKESLWTDTYLNIMRYVTNSINSQ